MTEATTKRHGLEHLLHEAPTNASTDPGVNIQILAGLCHVNLRGDPQDEHFVRATERVLGQVLPVAANTSSVFAHRVHWLGPDEWLILSDAKDGHALVTKLQNALAGLHAAVNEVSGGQLALRVSGERVRDVLAKGCTLDFHPAAFTLGMSAQSGLGKANVMISLVDQQPTFEIVVRRSFADYLARWLTQAAAEFGTRITAT